MTALAIAIAIVFVGLLAFMDRVLSRRPPKVDVDKQKLDELVERVGRIELAITTVRGRWGQTG